MTIAHSGWALTYRPGGAFLLVRDSVALMLGTQSPIGDVLELFEILKAPEAMENVLARVLANGLQAAPSFVLMGMQHDGSARLIVHGELSALVRSAGSKHLVAETRGIADRDIPTGALVAIGVETPFVARRDHEPADAILPLRSGVVYAHTAELRINIARPMAQPPEAETQEADVDGPRGLDADLRPDLVETAESLRETNVAQHDGLAPVGTASNSDAAEGDPEQPLAARPDFEAIWEQAVAEEPNDEPQPAPANVDPTVQPSWPSSTDLIESFPFTTAISSSVPQADQGAHSPTPEPDDGLDATVFRPLPSDILNAPTLARPPAHTDWQGALVSAARCPVGHLSPPYQAHCRVCRVVVDTDRIERVPRPALGKLITSTGQAVEIDRDIFLGRAPRIPDDREGESPHLIRLDDPTHEVSAQHARLEVHEWDMALTDLGSTNGTEVIAADGQHLTLAAWNPLPVDVGTVIILGGTIRVTLEADT